MILKNEELAVIDGGGFTATFFNSIARLGKTIYDKLDAFKDAEVENILLYTAITGSINVFITQYEEIMGKNSWKLLNNYIDLYCITKENEYLLSIFANISVPPVEAFIANVIPMPAAIIKVPIITANNRLVVNA